MEKVPADIGKRVEYLLNTGNLVSPGGLDLQQVLRKGACKEFMFALSNFSS